MFSYWLAFYVNSKINIEKLVVLSFRLQLLFISQGGCFFIADIWGVLTVRAAVITNCYKNIAIFLPRSA